MRKFLSLLILLIALNLSVKSQTDQPESYFFARCGYSWINGVIGGELFFNKVSIGGGWMTDVAPFTDNNISFICAQISYYNKGTNENSNYCSFGMANNNPYDNIYETDQPETIFVGILGYRWFCRNFDFKAGIGYGGANKYGRFTGEIGAGIKIY